MPKVTASARVGTGALIALVVVLAAYASGNSATFDPAAALLFAVVVGSTFAGRRGGIAAAGVTSVVALLYYGQGPWAAMPGNAVRMLLLVGAAGLTVALVGSLRQSADHLRSRQANRRGLVDSVQAFTAAVGDATDEALFDAIISHGRTLVDADVAVLTVLDPRSGRHVVRAVGGTPPSAVGVEVLPGVGITGQAIRDRRLVTTGKARTGEPAGINAALDRLTRLIPAKYARQFELRTTDNPSTALATVGTTPSVGRPLASVPAIHGGRVMATLTVGRSDGAPAFSESDRQAMEIVGPAVALTINNWLLRRQLREAAIRDPLSGLYNRAYLDAALEQLLALRGRTPPQQRRPLSLILFDIDDFRAFNEEHGHKAGDAVVRAIGALLRQRFRASDLLARVSGDGFLAVLDGAEIDVAEKAASDIRARIHALVLTDERGARVQPTISAGCAMFRNDAERSDAIIRSVEAALDTARWSGPGAIVSI